MIILNGFSTLTKHSLSQQVLHAYYPYRKNRSGIVIVSDYHCYSVQLRLIDTAK